MILMNFGMPGGLEDLLGAFYMIQLACYFTTYPTAMPGNTIIYITEFRKLISFDAIKPDNLLKMIDP